MTSPTTIASAPPGVVLDEEPGAADSLLELLAAFVRETTPEHAAAVRLDARLEAELGVGSLARLEIVRRVEARFDVRLSDRVVTDAETVRDLLAAVESGGLVARADPAGSPLDEPAPTGAGVGVPDDAPTLLHVLEHWARRLPDHPFVRLYGEDADLERDEPTPLTHAELLEGSGVIAAGLRAFDLVPGEAVALMLPTGLDFFHAFFGILAAGGVPVPLYPPARMNQIEDHLRRQLGIIENARVRLLVTVPEASRIAPILLANAPGLRAVTTVAEVRERGVASTNPAGRVRVQLDEDAIAFIQYTSGSTGQPKGVVMTHANLLANIRAMAHAAQVRPDDVFVSWLPLYHDMGLIGACFGTFYLGMPLVLMSPISFLVRPRRWLAAIARHRGSITAAPNFAYEICASKLTDAEIAGLDLSSWRLALNGAEPVLPETVERFAARFAGNGFPPEAMFPVYGLAENGLAVTFPPLGRGPRIDRVRREALVAERLAEPAPADDAAALAFVGAGQPIPNHEVRIVDEAGEPVPERVEGRLQFRGPSATRGYFENPEATAALIVPGGDGWRESGDRAYLAGGEVFITGRAKDLIIKGGRNIYPHEIEAAVGELPGVRKGCVAVFGTAATAIGAPPGRGGERLVVLAESRIEADAGCAELRARIAAEVVRVLGLPADEVVIAPPGTVLKTSSGKVRRGGCRQLYERGDLLGRASVRWQLARLALTGAVPRLRRLHDEAFAWMWAAWAFVVVAAFSPFAIGSILLLPGVDRRRAALRTIVRLACGLTGIDVRVHGAEHLRAASPCVFVANHQSYLDPLFLLPFLPGEHLFSAKGELRESWLFAKIVRRLGYRFVDRQSASSGAADLDGLTADARARRSPVFFAEGGFARAPGLLPFRMGAFLVAARAGAPVVPIVIRGSRTVLRDESLFPRRARVRIVVAPPIAPDGEGWDGAARLRDAARAEVLRRCGEPDLATGPGFVPTATIAPPRVSESHPRTDVHVGTETIAAEPAMLDAPSPRS